LDPDSYTGTGRSVDSDQNSESADSDTDPGGQKLRTAKNAELQCSMSVDILFPIQIRGSIILNYGYPITWYQDSFVAMEKNMLSKW
jgi:hypothetical protein